MTAEEFLNQHHQISHYYDDKGDQMVVPDSQVQQAMIEFAKLHVKAALEAALEDAPYGSSTDIPTYEDMKDSILNSYPETNIK